MPAVLFAVPGANLYILFPVLQEGQESSIAYSKCKSDIDTMRMDMDALNEKVNSAPNTEGLGGIPGLFGELNAQNSKAGR